MPGDAAAPLADRQGRRIRYLRLSLTDACNFACSYCSPHPERAGDGLPREAIARLVRVFAGLGVERVRLTGGEPTLRADLVEVVRDIAADVAAVAGIEEVALTTNGHLLADLARPLRQAGVSRLNVSLDTLRPERLARIAGPAATLPRIVRGVEEAAGAGYASLKLNTVVVRGCNEDELADLARFAWRHGAIARFIELMPFGSGEPVPVAEMERLLAAQGVRLAPDATRGWGPARHMRGALAGGERGLVGFIGALTETFCDGCNRVRVGPDGALRACLGGREAVPLRDLLAESAGEALALRIRSALAAKAERHRMDAGGLPPMMGTGG